MRGHRLFVAGVGTTLSAISHDAVIVAVDTRRATEVWRAIAGEPGRGDSFDLVAASGGRVCAVCRGIESFVTVVMLVACYEAATGRLLWEREFPTPGLRIAFNAFSIQLSGRALVVTINDPFTAVPRVLLFDARDGS